MSCVLFLHNSIHNFIVSHNYQWLLFDYNQIQTLFKLQVMRLLNQINCFLELQLQYLKISMREKCWNFSLFLEYVKTFDG